MMLLYAVAFSCNSAAATFSSANTHSRKEYDYFKGEGSGVGKGVNILFTAPIVLNAISERFVFAFKNPFTFISHCYISA